MVSLSFLALQVAVASTQTKVVGAPSELLQHGIQLYQAIKPLPPIPIIPVRGGSIHANKVIFHPRHNPRSLFLVNQEESPSYESSIDRDCSTVIDCLDVLMQDLALMQTKLALEHDETKINETAQSSSLMEAAPAIGKTITVQCESYAECVEKVLLKVLAKVTNQEHSVVVKTALPADDEGTIDVNASTSQQEKVASDGEESIWSKVTRSLSRSHERVVSSLKVFIKDALGMAGFGQDKMVKDAMVESKTDAPSLTRNYESDVPSKSVSSTDNMPHVDPPLSDPRDLEPSAAATRKPMKPLGATQSVFDTPEEVPMIKIKKPMNYHPATGKPIPKCESLVQCIILYRINRVEARDQTRWFKPLPFCDGMLECVDMFSYSFWPQSIEVEIVDPVYAAAVAKKAAEAAAAKRNIERQHEDKLIGAGFFTLLMLFIAFIFCQIKRRAIQFAGLWIGCLAASGWILYISSTTSWLITSPYPSTLAFFYPQVAAVLSAAIVATCLTELFWYSVDMPCYNWSTGLAVYSAVVYVHCTVYIYSDMVLSRQQQAMHAVILLMCLGMMAERIRAKIRARRNA